MTVQPRRMRVEAWLVIVILPLMMVGCQVGVGGEADATPTPAIGETGSNEKLIDGYLHVWYIPCPQEPPPPFDWVAPITLTDQRSGSHVYLNHNGTLKARPKPRYTSEEGRAALEAVLQDSALIEQVVARPSCDDRQSDDPRIRQQRGWPDAYAEDIGEPAIPKVAISTVPASTLGVAIYPGWRGSYCWGMNGENQECKDVDYWEDFAEANALQSRPDSTFHFTVLSEEASPGRISRIRMHTIQKRWALREFRRVVKRGEEVYSAEAQDRQSLDMIQVPGIVDDNYMLVASYESPLGEVEYGFKVEVR